MNIILSVSEEDIMHPADLQKKLMDVNVGDSVVIFFNPENVEGLFGLLALVALGFLDLDEAHLEGARPAILMSSIIKKE